jgi:translation initiation factor 2B subunit (eIF-2B alpha/beta/delta family)
MLKRLIRNLRRIRKKRKVKKIIKGIKNIRIQGARNVAISGLKAYSLIPTKENKKRLIKARPTEPLLRKVLNEYKKLGKKRILKHFEDSQKKINKEVDKLIKDGQVIFTHCHSSQVVSSLVYSSKKKNFQVYNTETRPLFQGRKTSKELKKAGIKVTQFVDSAARIALKALQGTKKADLVFLGADAITKKGAINKIGSGMFSQIAYENEIPVYIVADSWKYSSKVKLEERDFNEVWSKAPIKIKNPSFELIPKKIIKGVISEKGNLKFKKFLKKVS